MQRHCLAAHCCTSTFIFNTLCICHTKAHKCFFFFHCLKSTYPTVNNFQVCFTLCMHIRLAKCFVHVCNARRECAYQNHRTVNRIAFAYTHARRYFARQCVCVPARCHKWSTCMRAQENKKSNANAGVNVYIPVSVCVCAARRVLSGHSMKFFFHFFQPHNTLEYLQLHGACHTRWLLTME